MTHRAHPVDTTLLRELAAANAADADADATSEMLNVFGPLPF